MLETIDAITDRLMMFDIVTLRVILSLTDSLISSYPHITTLLKLSVKCNLQTFSNLGQGYIILFY